MAESKANLSVSWKAVAVAAIILAITSCTIAAIVATVKNADTLSVVALGVAVIAFIIQIIVFIVQAAAASDQSLRAQEVYGSTIKLLATIEEKAEGTRQTVTTINDKMLGALLAKFVSGSNDVLADHAAAGITNTSEIANVINRFSGSVRAASVDTPRDVASSEQEERPRVAIMFPAKEEVERILPILEQLDESTLLGLDSIGTDWSKYDSDTSFSGLTSVSQSDTLYEKGLIKRVRRDWSERPVFILTPDGEIATRLLLSKSIPNGVPPGVYSLRDKFDAAKSARDKRVADYWLKLDSDIPVQP